MARRGAVIQRGAEPTPPPEPLTDDEIREKTAQARERERKLMARGLLAALLYEETKDYAGIAALMKVTVPTVRGWVSRYKAARREEIDTIAARLQKTTVHLALDRIEEGLLEGETEFAAELGRKIVHGAGHLPGPPRAGGLAGGAGGPVSLTINLVKPDQKSAQASVIVDGHLVQSADGKAHAIGTPRQLAAAPEVLTDPGDRDEASGG